MRKILAVVVLSMLVASSAFAVTAEFFSDTGNTGLHTNRRVQQEGQTNFQFAGMAGNTKTGNTGWIGFMTTDTVGQKNPYYLWVDAGGNLCLSSYATISTYASFPAGDWRTGMPCNVVGSQSTHVQ